VEELGCRECRETNVGSNNTTTEWCPAVLLLVRLKVCRKNEPSLFPLMMHSPVLSSMILELKDEKRTTRFSGKERLLGFAHLPE
jgi:hypothetical protein